MPTVEYVIGFGSSPQGLSQNLQETKVSPANSEEFPLYQPSSALFRLSSEASPAILGTPRLQAKRFSMPLGGLVDSTGHVPAIKMEGMSSLQYRFGRVLLAVVLR